MVAEFHAKWPFLDREMPGAIARRKLLVASSWVEGTMDTHAEVDAKLYRRRHLVRLGDDRVGEIEIALSRAELDLGAFGPPWIVERFGDTWLAWKIFV
jgi:hypothetical protein